MDDVTPEGEASDKRQKIHDRSVFAVQAGTLRFAFGTKRGSHLCPSPQTILVSSQVVNLRLQLGTSTFEPQNCAIFTVLLRKLVLVAPGFSKLDGDGCGHPASGSCITTVKIVLLEFGKFEPTSGLLLLLLFRNGNGNFPQEIGDLLREQFTQQFRIG